jgi:hypothetical protein
VYLQRRTQPPGAARSTRTARTAHHGQVSVGERLDSTNSSAAICSSTPKRSLRRHMYLASLDGSPFSNNRLWVDSPPLFALIICASHVYRGGIIREYASSPSVPRWHAASQQRLAASPKGLVPGLNCHIVFRCFSFPVLPSGACRRPIPGPQEAPTCKLPRSWSLYCRSTI